MKVFIIMFNRLTWPKAMAQFLADTGCEVILIDNNSIYPPLLSWYENCPFKVHRLKYNYGHMAFWYSGLHRVYKDRYYVITDPDLDISALPRDYMDVLLKESALHDNVSKVGLSLAINDLPVNDFTGRIIGFESQYWITKAGTNGFYRANVDTTFALYDREKRGADFWAALRSPSPYTAKHLPWYLTKEIILSNPEESYYLKSCSSSASWADFMKRDLNIEL